ncbi:Ribosomal RNA-processing protein 7 [Steccherinum ochraceum]|uniref:Ribosomal RNA-processing protein 7 n=1 Tax=Steccherinum ochraceum TaxID=92696 RepID=A0A4R0R418_9APHY|nr:Ribosomal RNA-processing protein 7 [Steccherinum ochraceum]
MSTSTIAGFTPLRVPNASSSTPSTHIIYARLHSGSKKASRKGKEAVLPEGRTLFLVNVPPDATERELVLFFKHAGTVERVIFDGDSGDEQVENVEDEDDSDEDGEGEVEEEDAEAEEDSQPRKKRKTGKGAAKPTAPEVILLPPRPSRTFRKTGGTAHVIFTDDSSISRALAPSKKDRPWPTDPESPVGLAHYAALHASLRPPLDVVKAHADSYMELFDFEQAKKKQQSKYRKGEAIVDDDGFTLVTRGGAYGQTVGGGVGVASKKFQSEVRQGNGKRHRSKKDPQEKEAFYAFQIHEKKRNDLIELRQKWEEDKAKIEKLKSSRKFKPY